MQTAQGDHSLNIDSNLFLNKSNLRIIMHNYFVGYNFVFFFPLLFFFVNGKKTLAANIIKITD